MSKYKIDLDGIIRYANNKDDVIATLLQELADMSDRLHSVEYPDGHIEVRPTPAQRGIE